MIKNFNECFKVKFIVTFKTGKQFWNEEVCVMNSLKCGYFKYLSGYSDPLNSNLRKLYRKNGDIWNLYSS